MNGTPIPTRLLPAEKAPAGEVQRQAVKLNKASVTFRVFDGMQDFCLVLNRQRQAVHINKAFRDFLEEHGIGEAAGQRPGNLLGCRHSEETEGGCGTTDFCRLCGSAIALGEALRGEASIKECRILSKKSGEDLDLRVSAQPFSYDGEDFLLMSVTDIGDTKRREVLEKLLFRDLLETAGGVQGLVEAVRGAGLVDGERGRAGALGRLIELIFSQKDLDAAERGELLLKITEESTERLLNEVALLSRNCEEAKGKEIVVAGDCQDIKIHSDRTLLARILGHLVKNALEAEKEGARITLSSRRTGNGAAFVVHNPAGMPEEARLQVFQRSFSTKGPGRGTGTYGVRLFAEKYLKGSVSFTSGPAGTEFRAEFPAEI